MINITINNNNDKKYEEEREEREEREEVTDFTKSPNLPIYRFKFTKDFMEELILKKLGKYGLKIMKKL
jgi:hypothetical protein